MLSLILENAPKDRKLKCIELGSGNGGMTRFITKELLKLGRLEKMTGCNISANQNAINRKMAKEEGIPEEVFSIEHTNFDQAAEFYGPATFDVVFSSDSFMHSANKTTLMDGVSRLLTNGGVVAFADNLQAPNSKKEDLQPVYDRLHLPYLGDEVVYNKGLQRNGLTQILSDCKGSYIFRHYGAIKSKVFEKKKELAAAGIPDEYIQK